MENTRYIDNGKVKRDRIVADIKRGRINKDDVRKLVNEKDIQKAFFGDGFNKKTNQSDWNSEYLDELALVSVSEAFNKEYLLFLADVATYLRDQEQKEENKKKRTRLIVICTLILVIAGALIAIFASKSNNKDSASEKSKAVSNVQRELVKTLV